MNIPELPDLSEMPAELRDRLGHDLQSAEYYLRNYGEVHNRIRASVQRFQHLLCGHSSTKPITDINPNHPFGRDEATVSGRGRECTNCKLQQFTCAKCENPLELKTTERNENVEFAYAHVFECTNSACKDRMIVEHDNITGGGPVPSVLRAP